jgi:methylmalonyl-CoA mutase N-terminal domain/subunit
MVALRTQQIVAEESGVTNTVDPLAGSYYIEAKTKDIEDKAMEFIKKIDELGGAPAAIEKGYIQEEIMDAAYEYQMDIERGDRVIVGMNKYIIKEDAPKDLLKVDPAVGQMQTDKINALKSTRDNAAVAEKLAALKAACSTEDNLMPYIVDAVRAYGTLGEICGVMREVFGEYKQSIKL